jgi:hypothetical protein
MTTLPRCHHVVAAAADFAAVPEAAVHAVVVDVA